MAGERCDALAFVAVTFCNMPALEEYGASPPIELLRQLLGQGAVYDRTGLFLKTIQDIHICAACGPPEGGRHPVTPRLLRYFHLLQIPPTLAASGGGQMTVPGSRWLM